MIERLIWWFVLLEVMALGVGAALFAQSPPRVVTLAIGLLGGTDQEIMECTFSIGPGASVLLHPKGEFCPLARELVGRTGTLVFVPD